MSASYWDPLADALPQSVRDAMREAEIKAIHHGGGREGESVLMAGIRELLRHVELREVADERIASNRRADEVFRAAAKDEARHVSDTLHRQMADEHNTLVRVWHLYRDHRGRKTIQREALHRVLAPHEYEGEALL